MIEVFNELMERLEQWEKKEERLKNTLGPALFQSADYQIESHELGYNNNRSTAQKVRQR